MSVKSPVVPNMVIESVGNGGSHIGENIIRCATFNSRTAALMAVLRTTSPSYENILPRYADQKPLGQSIKDFAHLIMSVSLFAVCLYPFTHLSPFSSYSRKFDSAATESPPSGKLICIQNPTPILLTVDTFTPIEPYQNYLRFSSR